MLGCHMLQIGHENSDRGEDPGLLSSTGLSDLDHFKHSCFRRYFYYNLVYSVNCRCICFVLLASMVFASGPVFSKKGLNDTANPV